MLEYLQSNKSKFHVYRETYKPHTPEVLNHSHLKPVLASAPVSPQIAQIFPHLVQRKVTSVSFRAEDQHVQQIVAPLRIGCVLSGGQAPGGHNVIVGLYEYIKRKHPNSQLFGFLNGPHGIYSGKYIQILDSHISYFKNRGGFDMICSGRHKIQTPDQFSKSLQYCEGLKLDGLVVIGGDDSNTNAALLAEYFLSKGSNIKVVGCPKTIDGDLKNDFVEVSFGFDTACKTYAQCIGSVMIDTLSSKKYYHFIRLMGRSASHIALECALLTRPTYTFIGEQVSANKSRLRELVGDLVNIIKKRSKDGKDYGIILVPEGLIEFVVEMNVLIKQINHIMAENMLLSVEPEELFEKIAEKLTHDSQELLRFLPKSISEQLLLDRDSHGNVQVAKIETEKLIIQLVRKQLEESSDYKGKFDPQSNYFGYEGRCAFPTNFDCDYCYSLGMNAAAIIESGPTGLMSCIRNLSKPTQQWLAGGYPLITMMDIETRKGKHVPVITKALVDLNGPIFKLFCQERHKWAEFDYFNNVGPIQFEFESIPPFLAVPPIQEQLYLENPQKKYLQKPYAEIYSYNMNNLTIALKDRIPQTPEVLAFHPRLAFSQVIPFKSPELSEEVNKHYNLIRNISNKYIEFYSKRKSTNSDILQNNTSTKVRKIGICFNGRQTPGGHSIIGSLIRQPNTEVYGFIDGTKGLFKNHHILITQDDFELYNNQSGFHFLGRSSDKLRDPEELKATHKTCQSLELDGLILVGATHTLTDALGLANYFVEIGSKTRVIGIPASIDNTVYHAKLEVSVGFSSSSHLYSTLIANLMTDASSNTKYWYFIRLMGRQPSNLALECALATHPNLVLISEEVEAKGWDIEEVVLEIVRVILEREAKGLGFGCIIIPEGIINYLPSIKRIVKELDQIKSNKEEQIIKKLSTWSRYKYEMLPDFIRNQLLSRENTNVVALSQIQTEKMFAHLVATELKKLKMMGKYKGSFSAVCHFFGYQGRCALPNQFDQNLAYSYAKIASILIDNQVTGYCPTIKGTSGPVEKWIPAAIPLVQMLRFKPHSINKIALAIRRVHLKSKPFKQLEKLRDKWILVDHYENPGPIQFFGLMRTYVPLTLTVANENQNSLIEEIQNNLKVVSSLCRFGVDEKVLKIAKIHLQSLIKTLQVYHEG